MANRKDCEICMKMMKAKHKADKFYKIGFWIVTILLVIISALYFSSGEVFKTTEINNDNSAEVLIENGESDNNTNNVNINQG